MHTMHTIPHRMIFGRSWLRAPSPPSKIWTSARWSWSMFFISVQSPLCGWEEWSSSGHGCIAQDMFVSMGAYLLRHLLPRQEVMTGWMPWQSATRNEIITWKCDIQSRYFSFKQTKKSKGARHRIQNQYNRVSVRTCIFSAALRSAISRSFSKREEALCACLCRLSASIVASSPLLTMDVKLSR